MILDQQVTHEVIDQLVQKRKLVKLSSITPIVRTIAPSVASTNRVGSVGKPSNIVHSTKKPKSKLFRFTHSVQTILVNI